MRIVIDMQGAQSESRFRGIGRYTISLALALARNAKEHEIWLVVNSAFPESILSIRHAFKGLIPAERIRVFEIPLPVNEENPENQDRTRVAELLREYFLEQLNPDVVLVSSLFEGYVDNAVTSINKLSSNYNTAVILYDLIPYIHAEQYLASPHQNNYYMRKIEFLRKSKLHLAISNSSKQEAIKYLNIEENKITNISTAVDTSFIPANLTKEQIRTLHNKYNITRNMIMYAPGGFDIRKNFAGLINAYGLLSKKLRDNYQLVIVSKVQEENRTYLNQLAKEAGLKDDELIITGYVPDEDLISLYSTAGLFVFPSKHEGFGLPVLEAISCGAPTIGSNTTSIPEVIGCAEALFDPESPESIATKIEEVLNNPALLDTIIKKEQEHKKSFSWDESAKKVISLFEDKLKSSKKSNNILYQELLDSIINISSNDSILLNTAKCMSFNQLTPIRNFYIDISELVRNDAKTGIQRVVRSILLELLKKSFENIEVKAIYFDGNSYKHANKFTNTILGQSKDSIKDEDIEFKQDDIYLGLDLNVHLTHAVHSLHKHLKTLGVQMYYVVYDILLLQHPQWWKEGISTMFNDWFKSISEISTGLLCISEAVANEVREKIEEDKPNRLDLPEIKSFHLGADINNSIPSKGLTGNYEYIMSAIGSRVTFLMVGTIEPRKGHTQTLNAFEILWSKDYDINLVIVGKEGWLVDELVQKLKNHPELNKRLFWLEGISDEYLEKVYSSSSCLIAASEGEGFGLPLIEAAQKKMPIIARDIPVFKEVAKEYAYYFEDSKEPSVIAQTVEKWIEAYKEDKHPKSDYMPYLTWKESSEQLLNCLGI